MTEAGLRGPYTLWPEFFRLLKLRPQGPGSGTSLTDFRGVALDIARRAAWIHLSKKRKGYAGCRQGVDHSATLKFQKRLSSSAQQEQMLSILCDGVWSQCRAAQKGVCDGNVLTPLTLKLILTTSGGNALGFRNYKNNSSEMKKRCNNFLHSKLSGSQSTLGCFGLEWFPMVSSPTIFPPLSGFPAHSQTASPLNLTPLLPSILMGVDT